MNRVEFGRRLAAAQEARGMEGKELARRLGYSSPSALVHWKKGTRTFPLEKVNEVCSILRITPGYLFGTEPMNAEVVRAQKVEELRSQIRVLDKELANLREELSEHRDPTCRERGNRGDCVRSKAHRGGHWNGRDFYWGGTNGDR